MTRPILRCRALLALLLSIWLGSVAAIAQCNTSLQSGGPIATLRGEVGCSVLWDPDGTGPLPTWLVVGGRDLTGGDQPAQGVGLLAFDGAQWRDLGFGANPVLTLAVFQGELVVGGSFVLQTAGGSVANIARRSGTSWLPLGHGFSGAVFALTVFAGELVVGGQWSNAGGINAPIARWNGIGWSSLGGVLTQGTVAALASFGALYVGGNFSTPVGHSLLRWNGTTWSAAGNPTMGGVALGVRALRAFTGTTHGTSFLVAAGRFDSIGGVAVNGVARAGSGVSSWSAMGTLPAGLSVEDLFITTPFLGTPVVYATGRNTSPARVAQWNGTAWNPTGSLGPTTGTATAHGLLLYGGAFVVGLDGPVGAEAVFRFTNDWTPLAGKGFSAPVQCLASDGPSAIAGGAFAVADGVIVHGIARRSGTTWGPLGTGVSGGTATVLAVARASNGEVFAGGSFTAAGGTAASNVARWNGSAWAPLGTGTNGTVRSLLASANGDLVAGGDFTTAGGVACNRIARWNGTAWSPLSSGMNDAVRCLTQRGTGEIVAGGSFTLAGGVACSRVASWNGTTWSSIDVGMNDAVHALALGADGVLFAGGAFTTVGGSRPCLRVARFDGAQWMSLGGGVNAPVNALAVLPNGDVLLGGSFADLGMSRLARYHRLGNTIATVPQGVVGPNVFALAAAANGDVQIGGDFNAIQLPQAAGLLAAGHLAILTTNCPALATTVPTACVGPAGPLTLTADTLPWVGATFRSTATGYAAQALAVSAFGLLPANLPLAQLHPTGLPNCNLLTSTESLLLALPVAGVSHHQLAVPNSAVFAGMQVSHQCLQLSLNGSGLLQSISSSNALTLVMGLL
ncbi:MAG: hypothetical protein KA020_13670 [Planctomycetes bacterium]|nr:hypothetical protein [Planctomycetota bacterium]